MQQCNKDILKMIPFMFHRKKTIRQVWNDMRVNKWGLNFHLSENYSCEVRRCWIQSLSLHDSCFNREQLQTASLNSSPPPTLHQDFRDPWMSSTVTQTCSSSCIICPNEFNRHNKLPIRAALLNEGWWGLCSNADSSVRWRKIIMFSMLLLWHLAGFHCWPS